MRRYFFMLIAVGGCGPGLPPGGVGGEDSGAGGTTIVDGTTVVGEVPTSGTGGVGGVTTGVMPGSEEGSGVASTGSDDGFSILGKLDLTGGGTCDLFLQDCPRGEKCASYANDGGSSWNDAKCVPVMEDPAQPGEPCFVEGSGVSGIDDCDLGAMCWDVGAENMGTCVALCTGSLDAPMCPTGFACAVSQHLSLCLEACDPLGQDCPTGDELCVPVGDGFLCVLDASGDEGQVNDPCMYANACDAGLYCIGSGVAGEVCDPATDGCCQPFCDVTAPNICAGVGQECVAWYEEGTAPPGYENVGICRLPG